MLHLELLSCEPVAASSYLLPPNTECAQVFKNHLGCVRVNSANTGFFASSVFWAGFSHQGSIALMHKSVLGFKFDDMCSSNSDGWSGVGLYNTDYHTIAGRYSIENNRLMFKPLLLVSNYNQYTTVLFLSNLANEFYGSRKHNLDSTSRVEYGLVCSGNNGAGREIVARISGDGVRICTEGVIVKDGHGRQIRV